MRYATLLATTLALSLSASLAYAGGCILKDVTWDKQQASLHMKDLVQKKIRDIDAKMQARGEDLSVVLVARQGKNSMDGLGVIEDDLNLTFQNKLNQLYSQVGAEGFIPEKIIVKQNGKRAVLQYSHFGFYLKRDYSPGVNAPEKDKDWTYISHLLAECDMKSKRYGHSQIFLENFANFFWDTKDFDSAKSSKNSKDVDADPVLPKVIPTINALIIVPAPAVQKRVWQILHQKEIAEDGLHEPKYNVIATPFRLRPNQHNPDYHQLTDQNSDQWPLEVLAAAMRPDGEVRTRAQAQDVLWQTNYHPSFLQKRGLKELNACRYDKTPFFDATNIMNCNDQYMERNRMIEVVTVDSVVNYLYRNHLLAENVDAPGRPATYEVSSDPEVIKTIIMAAPAANKINAMVGNAPAANPTNK